MKDSSNPPSSPYRHSPYFSRPSPSTFTSSTPLRSPRSRHSPFLLDADGFRRVPTGGTSKHGALPPGESGLRSADKENADLRRAMALSLEEQRQREATLRADDSKRRALERLVEQRRKLAEKKAQQQQPTFLPTSSEVAQSPPSLPESMLSHTERDSGVASAAEGPRSLRNRTTTGASATVVPSPFPSTYRLGTSLPVLSLSAQAGTTSSGASSSSSPTPSSTSSYSAVASASSSASRAGCGLPAAPSSSLVSPSSRQSPSSTPATTPSAVASTSSSRPRLASSSVQSSAVPLRSSSSPGPGKLDPTAGKAKSQQSSSTSAPPPRKLSITVTTIRVPVSSADRKAASRLQKTNSTAQRTNALQPRQPVETPRRHLPPAPSKGVEVVQPRLEAGKKRARAGTLTESGAEKSAGQDGRAVAEQPKEKKRKTTAGKVEKEEAISSAGVSSRGKGKEREADVRRESGATGGAGAKKGKGKGKADKEDEMDIDLPPPPDTLVRPKQRRALRSTQRFLMQNDGAPAEEGSTLPPPPPHIADVHDLQRASGSDILQVLIDGSEDEAERTFWTTLPAAVATERVTDNKRVEEEKRRAARRKGLRRILDKHGCVVPEREMIEPDGWVEAVLSSSWHFAVPSRHLNGRVFNPAASPTFRIIGDVVPRPTGDSFWPDMFDYVSPSKVSKKSGATPAKPFLITETITPECAKEIYAYLFPLNEAKHRRRAYPPKGKKRFTILNGREPKAEFERALESLEGGAGEAFEVVRRRRRFSFKGAKSRYFYVDDGVREQELIFIRDRNSGEIRSAFVHLDHTSYYLYGGSPSYSSACVTDRFYSLFADLVRIDNDTAVSSTITTAASPSTVVSPTFPSPPVSTTSLSCPPPPDIDIDLSLTSDDDDDYTPELETASGENRPSFASTFKSTFAPIPPASPLRPFLSTSTASIRFSMQSMLRPDNRTEEEKRESIRRRTELNKSTQRDTYRETQEQKRLNPPADVVVRINSFDTIYDWMSKARGKNTATEEFKAIGGFVEGVKSNEVTKDQMRAWMRAEGYFPPDTTGADIRLTDYKAKQAAKEANPPADVVAQIRSFMTTKAWTTGGTERGNAATKEFRAVGGYIEGVAAPQVTRPQMKHWLAKKGYLVFNG